MRTRSARISILVVLALVVAGLASPAGAGGPNKTAIAGTATLEVVEDSVEAWVTPGGVLHEFGGLGSTEIFGDLVGTDSLEYKGTSTMTADMSVYVVRAASSGELVWNGRTGPFTGMTFAKCEFEFTGLLFACTGHSTYHGSGELDGVFFRINWTGTWGLDGGDFTYTGFAIDPHG